MTYKQFANYMDRIKKIQKYSKRVNDVFSEVGDVNFFYFSKWEEDLISLLSITMQDEFDYIGYYIYEIEWGKRGKNCITEKDGTKICLTNYKQLYNYIK